ncbi:MAG TPA: hypothetical protein VKE51_31540 [Vicinamibacterales bacterium]|nr:hypothetical protein [Vicinamibacterales bacterium]
MDILEFPAASTGMASDNPATVFRAYFEAQRARASRQFLCAAVPVITGVLVAVQAAAGWLARGALLAQTALSLGVPAAAAVVEWRATRKLHALVRSAHLS